MQNFRGHGKAAINKRKLGDGKENFAQSPPGAPVKSHILTDDFEPLVLILRTPCCICATRLCVSWRILQTLFAVVTVTSQSLKTPFTTTSPQHSAGG